MKKLFLSKTLGRDSISTGDFIGIVASRMDVINTMREWIHNGGGVQDALDDLELYKSLAAFLSQPPEHLIPESAQGQNDEVKHFLTNLNDARAELHQSFILHIRRPQMQMIPLRGQSIRGEGGKVDSQPPDLTKISPEALVQNIDALASTFFRSVTQEVSLLLN